MHKKQVVRQSKFCADAGKLVIRQGKSCADACKSSANFKIVEKQ